MLVVEEQTHYVLGTMRIGQHDRISDIGVFIRYPTHTRDGWYAVP